MVFSSAPKFSFKRCNFAVHGIGTIHDDKKIGVGRIAKTNSNTFGIDKSADVGVDQNTPVFAGYHGKEQFTGKINRVTVETFLKKHLNTNICQAKSVTSPFSIPA